MSGRPDNATRLERALRLRASEAGLVITVGDVRLRPWASATFIGMCVHLTISGPDTHVLADWIATLPDMEFELPRVIVADIVVEARTVLAGTCVYPLVVLLIEAA